MREKIWGDRGRQKVATFENGGAAQSGPCQHCQQARREFGIFRGGQSPAQPSASAPHNTRTLATVASLHNLPAAGASPGPRADRVPAQVPGRHDRGAAVPGELRRVRGPGVPLHPG